MDELEGGARVAAVCAIKKGGAMKFNLSDGSTFNIPDRWWNESGMTTFSPGATAYPSKALTEHPDHPIVLVATKLIKPLRRAAGVTLDFGGFGEARMRRVLQWIAQGSPMEPIQVIEKPDGSFHYAVYHGFHRFHAAVAAGFTEIPVAVAKWGLSWDQ